SVVLNSDTTPVHGLLDPRDSSKMSRFRAALLGLASGNNSDLSTVVMHFDGANLLPTPLGMDRLHGVSNDLVGTNAANYVTDIANFGEAHYRGAYDGIDLVYKGTEGSLEFDFLVNPGADPGVLSFSFPGLSAPTLSQGNLRVRTLAATDLTLTAPVLWQNVGGHKVQVSGQYFVRPNVAVGIQVWAYDHTPHLLTHPPSPYASHTAP